MSPLVILCRESIIVFPLKLWQLCFSFLFLFLQLAKSVKRIYLNWMALAEYMAFDTGQVNYYTPLIKDKSVEF